MPSGAMNSTRLLDLAATGIREIMAAQTAAIDDWRAQQKSGSRGRAG